MVQFAVLFLYLCMEKCHRELHGRVIVISPMRPEHFYINTTVTNLWYLVYHLIPLYCNCWSILI